MLIMAKEKYLPVTCQACHYPQICVYRMYWGFLYGCEICGESLNKKTVSI